MTSRKPLTTFVRGAPPGYSQIASVVRGMGIRGETKALDVPLGVIQFAPGNNNSITLNATQEGAGFWNRIGRKISMKSLQITGYILQANNVGAQAQEVLRYIIGYDKQPNGVAITWNQVVQAYDNAGGTTNAVTDGVNLDNRDRFVVLRDRKIMMPRISAAGVPTGPPWGTAESSVGQEGKSDGGCQVSEYIKLENYECQYNGTTNPATVGTIITGNLFIVLQGTAGNYELALSSRLRFTDC